MDQLINVSTNSQGEQVVSARELHKFLEQTERFNNWCQRMFSYGFVEQQDYIGCKFFNTLANQELDDYALTLDCAKEISMLQRSEKGKQARQYFIQCEKQLRNVHKALSPKELALLVIQAEEEKERLQNENQHLNQTIQLQAPKVEYVDTVLTTTECMNTTQIAAELSWSARRLNQELQRLGVQYKSNGSWVLSYKYKQMEERNGIRYTEMRTTVTEDEKGVHTRIDRVWTQRGRALIHWLIKQDKQARELAFGKD